MSMPCYGCTERHAKCHVDCQKYAKHMEENEQNKKERHQEVAVKVYQVDQKNRAVQKLYNRKKWRRRVKR